MAGCLGMFIPGRQLLDYGLWSILNSIDTRVGLKSEEFDLFSGHVEVGLDHGNRLVGSEEGHGVGSCSKQVSYRLLQLTQTNYREARRPCLRTYLRFPTDCTCAVPALAYGYSLSAPIGVLLS